MATLLVDRETTQTRYCSCSNNTVPKSSYEVNCICSPREIPVLASWYICSLRKHLERFFLEPHFSLIGNTPYCAVWRMVISLVQPGRTRREVLESFNPPGPERERGQEHVGNAEST
jgi:hypothetical protein